MPRAWESFVERLKALQRDAEDWTRDRHALPRALLLAYLTYAGLRHIANPTYRSWFGGITLAFHEMGHIVLSPLGRTLGVLGGSIFQLLVPTAAALYLLLRQRDYFGFAVGGGWLSFSLWELATYVGDARKQALPLVGFSNHPEHDWTTLLRQWDLLSFDETFAVAIRIGATLTWAASIALGVWLCWRMAFTPRNREAV